MCVVKHITHDKEVNFCLNWEGWAKKKYGNLNHFVSSIVDGKTNSGFLQEISAGDGWSSDYYVAIISSIIVMGILALPAGTRADPVTRPPIHKSVFWPCAFFYFNKGVLWGVDTKMLKIRSPEL